MALAFSSDGSTYTVNSERAYDFVNNASIGQYMTGGDGSTWTRLIDGRTRIDKDGQSYYYGNSQGDASSAVFGNSDLNGAIDELIKVSDANSARSADEAADLRRWQEKQNAIAMNFNAMEAARNRDWQAYMSNTAHQREVEDLRAAGLNPILSATGGNGSAVTSGATASGVTSAGAKGEVDMSADAAIVNLLGTMLQMQNNMAMSTLSAQTNLAVADKYNAASELVAQISGMYGLRSAGEAAAASRYASDSATDRLVKQLEWNETHPDSIVEAVNALVGAIVGDPEHSGIGNIADLSDWLRGLSGAGSFHSGSGSSSHSGKFNKFIFG